MRFGMAIKSAGAQAAWVTLLFVALVAAPLPEGFFRDYGFAVGPVAWLACALLTGRLLSMRPMVVLGAAVAGGATGAALTAAGAHILGLAAAVVVFGLACGALIARSETRSPTTLDP